MIQNYFSTIFLNLIVYFVLKEIKIIYQINNAFIKSIGYIVSFSWQSALSKMT